MEYVRKQKVKYMEKYSGRFARKEEPVCEIDGKKCRVRESERENNNLKWNCTCVR